MHTVVVHTKKTYSRDDLARLLDEAWADLRDMPGIAKDDEATRTLLSAPREDVLSVFDTDEARPMGFALSGAVLLIAVKIAMTHIPFEKIAEKALEGAAAELMKQAIQRILSKRPGELKVDK